MTQGTLASIAVALLLGACAGAPADEGAGMDPSPAAQGSTGPQELVPPGFGTLRQDAVTVSLRSGDLLVKVTPLAEWITRLTAPDTYARLAGLARSHGPELARQARLDDPALFLVSFFSYQPDVVYQPEDLELIGQGLRYRPLAIRAVTPGWNTQRLGQQETQLAVYAFDPALDLRTDLEVEYRESRNSSWEAILSVIQAEAAKVRARAGSPGGASRASP